MPLAERRGAVPVLRQDPRPRRAISGNHRRVTGKAAGELTDRAETDRMVIPPRQQRRTGRRAQRGDVEPVVAQAPVGHPRVVRGVNRTAERARIPEAGVIDQDQQHIRGPLRRLRVPDQVPVRLRSLQRPVAHPLEQGPATSSTGITMNGCSMVEVCSRCLPAKRAARACICATASSSMATIASGVAA